LFVCLFVILLAIVFEIFNELVFLGLQNKISKSRDFLAGFFFFGSLRLYCKVASAMYFDHFLAVLSPFLTSLLFIRVKFLSLVNSSIF